MKETKNKYCVFVLVVCMYRSQYLRCLVNKQDMCICMSSFVVESSTTYTASIIGPIVITLGIPRGFLLLGLFVRVEIRCCDGIVCAIVILSMRPHMQWRGRVHMKTTKKEHALANTRVRLTTHTYIMAKLYATANVIIWPPVYENIISKPRAPMKVVARPHV